MTHKIYAQQKALVRPRSSLSNDEHRLKSSLPPPRKTRQNNSIVIASLIGACVFFLVLCGCLVAALVFVGKNLALNSNATNVDLHSGESDAAKTASHLNSDQGGTRTRIQIRQPIIVFRPDQLDNNGKRRTDSESTENIIRQIGDPVHSISELLAIGRSPSEVNDNLSAVSKMSSSAINKVRVVSKVIERLSFRLPEEIRPRHYDLFLEPQLSKKTFSGNVKIRLQVLKPIPFIALHAKNLNIIETNVVQILNATDEISVPVLQTFEHLAHEYWVTEFENPLDSGEYAISLSFNANLGDRIIGFYQSSYFDPISNNTRWIATSKFEPTYARQAFPCFDEPAMKATFEVSLRYPNLDGYHALSNMDIKEIKTLPEENHTIVVFNNSVPMSTYLACFIVSDFESKNANIESGGIGDSFEMRVFATPAQKHKVEFALQTGKLVTEHYIRYFNISYPLPKLDMVAIPDFVSGAMEHWGLVTFRETSLLYDRSISSTSNKQRVGTVIAHELAHMWFGNLVTMKWWNDLWLNEGFASYMEYKALSAVYPEWDMATQFIIADLHGVMRLDATLAAHPIVQKVENPDQITELFDAITYQKGASVIRMLENFIGEDRFQEAVTNYLRKFSYNNAITDDFLTEIDALGLDFDVKLIMETWTQQMGLPVVNVEQLDDSHFKLTQKRFFSNPENINKQFNDSKFNYKWFIPITYFTSESANVQREWFKNDDAEITIELPTPVKWIKLNKDQYDYYRVNYPVPMWTTLTNALLENKDIMTSADRAHLLNDAFTLADATQLPYDVALNLTKYLRSETEFVPWSVAANRILAVERLLFYTDILSTYRKYGQNLVEDAYRMVGWTVGEKHTENLVRTEILELACSIGLPDCINTVANEFNQWLDNPDVRPSPDIRNIIYYHGMSVVVDESKWLRVWDLFVAEQDANEKIKLMRALAATKIPWLLRRYVELAWNKEYVRTQDYFICLGYIAGNRAGEQIVWDHVRENWPKIVDRFGLNERSLGNIIPSITGRFATKVKLQEMEDFFAAYPQAGAGVNARKQALENVRNNIKWLESNKELVANWLKSF